MAEKLLKRAVLLVSLTLPFGCGSTNQCHTICLTSCGRASKCEGSNADCSAACSNQCDNKADNTLLDTNACLAKINSLTCTQVLQWVESGDDTVLEGKCP